jgi:hypothetical protein
MALGLLGIPAGAIACSSEKALPSGTFPPEPLEIATSSSGESKVAVRTSPQPTVRGTNLVELTITNASDGLPRDGLLLDMKPWMPAMNHGSSAITSVVAEGGGKYLVSDVDLFMPGRWELRTSIAGRVNDHVAPPVDIP